MKIYSLIRKHPYLRLVFPLIVGILSATYFYTYFQPIFNTLLLIGAVFIALTIILTITKTLAPIQKHLIILVVYLIGTVITCYHLYSPNAVFAEQKWTGIIYDSPEQKTNSFLIPIKVSATQFNAGYLKKSQKVQLYTKVDSITATQLQIGKTIKFTAKLTQIKNRNNPDEFNYARFMAGKRILLQAYCSSEKIAVSKDIKKTFAHVINKLQMHAQNTYNRYISDKDALSVINALALGDKQFLDDDIRQSFVNAGAIHVLAVSGLHIGIVFAFVNYLLFFLNRTTRLRTIKIIVTIVVIWAYASLTGLSPSVNRAATMFTLISIGKNLNRDISYFNILAFAAFILLVANPLSIYNVGFQLSFVAVGGIVYFQPKLFALITIRNKVLREIYKVLTVSVAAQLATTPLILYYFHQFPTYFWLTNLLLIYLICASLILSLLMLLLGWIPYVGSSIAFVLQYIIKGTNKWVQVIESLPYSTINNVYINQITLIGLFLLLMLLSIWVVQKKVRFLNYAITTLIAMQLFSFIYELKPSIKQIVFYNHNKSNYIGVFNGIQNILFYSATDTMHEQTSKYYFHSHWQKQKLKAPFLQSSIDSLIRKHEGKLPFIRLSDKSTVLWYHSNRLEVPENFLSTYTYVYNYLWPPNVKLNTSKIVLGNTLSASHKSAWTQYCAHHNIELISLNNGAFIISQ